MKMGFCPRNSEKVLQVKDVVLIYFEWIYKQQEESGREYQGSN